MLQNIIPHGHRLAGVATALVLLAATLPAAAAPPPGEHWVSVNGSDAAAGTMLAPWRHLQYAVKHVWSAPGQPPPVIRVGAGTYSEQVVIDHAVAIRGVGTDDVIVENPVDTTYQYPGGLPDVDDPSYVILAEGDFDLALSDLTVNGRFTTTSGNPGIKADRVGLKLDRVEVLVPHARGIALRDLDTTNRTFSIARSAITTRIPSGEFGTDIGVHIINSSGVFTEFTGGTAIDHVIHIQGGRDILIERSTIYGAPIIHFADGIRAWSGNIRVHKTEIVRPPSSMFGPAEKPPANDGEYSPQRPYAGIEAVNHDGQGVTALHLEIDGCRIEGFDEGIGLYIRGEVTSGPLPHTNTVKVQNTRVSGLTADVATRWQSGWSERPTVDLGGGALGSVGHNVIGQKAPSLTKPPAPLESLPWLFYHRAPYSVPAHGNEWLVPENEIEARIWDRLDVMRLGRLER